MVDPRRRSVDRGAFRVLMGRATRGFTCVLGISVWLLALAPASSSAATSGPQALAIASALPAVKRVLATHSGPLSVANVRGSGVWEERFFSAETEIAVVLVSSRDGHVISTYTGYQVLWTMARGTPGAFGRHIEALYVWIPLSMLFVIPFIDFRRLRRMLHLDLLLLSSLSVSLAFFDRGNIGMSVPLAYPPLLYLLGRLAWIGLGRGGRPPPLRLNVPVGWLSVGVVFLLAFRIGLEVGDANVIDVGYASGQGAHQILAGKPLYGQFPAAIAHGDTYGPVTYEAYVPAVALLGFSGRWDSLPAVRATDALLDLLCVVLLFALGRRIRGPSMGVVLAYAWASFPFTSLALESNANDALVAALILAVLLAESKPAARGAFAMLAALTKLAPIALLGMFATHRLRERGPRSLALFVLGALLAGAIAFEPALRHDSLREIYERTIGYQASRSAPFSVWGLYGGLGAVQTAVQLLGLALAVALAVLPRRGDVVGLAACAAAVLIAVQLGVTYWFYLYVPWFFAPAAVALLGRHEQLFDRVRPARLARSDQRRHQPGVLLGG